MKTIFFVLLLTLTLSSTTTTSSTRILIDSDSEAETPIPSTTVPLPLSATVAAAGHSLIFYMHDILGGSNPTARAVTGVVTNPALNAQVAFAKPNGANLPLNSGLPQNNNNAGFLNNNNLPFLIGLSGNPGNIINNVNGGTINNVGNGGVGFSVTNVNQVPAGMTLQKLIFGTMTVFDDELTVGHELGLGLVGKAQGFYIASAEDGTGHVLGLTAMFEENGYKDSISLFGVHRTQVSESHIAVIGGTGNYQNAQGFAVTKTFPVTNNDQHTTDGVETLLQITLYLTTNTGSIGIKFNPSNGRRGPLNQNAMGSICIGRNIAIVQEVKFPDPAPINVPFPSTKPGISRFDSERTIESSTPNLHILSTGIRIYWDGFDLINDVFRTLDVFPNFPQPSQFILPEESGMSIVNDFTMGNSGVGFSVTNVNQVPTGMTLQKLMFGTMTVFDDELTEGHELGSGLVGKAQGFYIASAEDGTGHVLGLTAMFEENGYKDSISLFGVHRTQVSESHIAVIGGTGKYQNAQGFAITKTFSVTNNDQHNTDGVETLLQITLYLTY
ncbi:dirigent protein 10-like [Senna tora]|uniref:Dirigent protein n=1 Tax=Senna tora TaxID=362788 RepID=A0A834TMF0_9FABA|nr:dirigent protein 10-like [Senna tora]